MQWSNDDQEKLENEIAAVIAKAKNYEPDFSAPDDVDDVKVVHKSGATASHHSPFCFNHTFEGAKLTSLRFQEGNRYHEDDNPVYVEANWLKAVYERDVMFFRNRAGHALEHLIDEMRGKDDPKPGGNLGAVGWFQDIMAFTRKHDPFLYGAIQGKWRIDDEVLEKTLGYDRDLRFQSNDAIDR